MPDVTLREVPRSEKALFFVHFQEYLAELSLYSGSRPDGAGVFHYDWLDHYWLEDRRMPFFIEAEDETAGLVLLRKLTDTESTLRRASLQLAEIFVFRTHRRRAIAGAVMRLAAQMAEGRDLPLTWSAYANNNPANGLYRATLEEFGSMDVPWETGRTQGMDWGGLARFYYQMTPPSAQKETDGSA